MRYLIVFFLLLRICCFRAEAQSEQAINWKRLDSLNKILGSTKEDSSLIRLRCLIGEAGRIDRISYWDSIVSDARKENRVLYEIKALEGLAGAYHTGSEREKALTCLNEALALAEKNSYKPEAIKVINKFIFLGFGQTERKSTLDLYYKGLKLAEDLRDQKAMIDFYSRIATYYFLSGDIDKALKMHLNCLRISRELGYRYGIASALIEIGSDYHALKDEKKAIAYYLESAGYAEDFSETVYGAYIYNSVGSAYEIMGSPDSAYKYSHKAYNICKKLGNKRGQAGSMVVMAKAVFQKGDIAGAKNMAVESLSLCRSVGFTAQIPDLVLFMTEIYTKLGDFKRALEAHQLYVNVRDSISDEKTRKHALEREFTYNYEKKENENKLLAQQNQIQSLKLIQDKYLLAGLGGLLLLILLMAFLFIRQNRLNAKHRALQLEQKLLRAQMNPHFIFNSLNAIKQFIMSSQNRQAELYLSKFAKLMRDLLESNIKESISVREEADMLSGYIEMESLRFGKSFSYRVKIDERINAETIHIPHMMVQPFVENAIWHGLLPKDEDRQLDVLFEPGPGRTIGCIVDDNGVGREASFKQENTFKRRSLALSMVKQRLKIIEGTLKVACGVRTVDKTDEDGSSLGTKIIIILPLIG